MVIEYQDFMGAVDKGDQARMYGSGWANKGHLRKWYKKGFHGVLDIMLLQSWIGWRLAVSEHASEDATNVPAGGTTRWKASLKKQEFNVLVAMEMMTYIDTDAGAEGAGNVILNDQQHATTVQFEEGHHPVPLPSTDSNGRRLRFQCLVCSLENSVRRLANLEELSETYNHQGLARCEAHGMAAHYADIPNRRMPLLPGFEGLTCYQILHHSEIVGAITTPGHRYVTSHKVYRWLRGAYDLPHETGRSRNRRRQND
jgi:hypothetical protein